MQRDQGVIDEALEKLASQVHIELADVRARERNMVVQAWKAGKIDDDARQCFVQRHIRMAVAAQSGRSEEHTSELQSLMRHSYAVLCLTKQNTADKTCHYYD